MRPVVRELAVVPVKGMRVRPVDEIDLTGCGVAGDRDFLVVDEHGDLLITERNPELAGIVPDWSAGVLTLRFPDGGTVSDVPEPGATLRIGMYDGRPLTGRLVGGPLARALTERLGRPVRLLRRDPDERGADDAAVSLTTRASLDELAGPDGTRPDPHRFRMTMVLDGAPAWAELGWAGREIVVGGATLRVTDPIPRCVVINRNPGTGRPDTRLLHAVARHGRAGAVRFGMWAEVAVPGRVRVGDVLRPA